MRPKKHTLAQKARALKLVRKRLEKSERKASEAGEPQPSTSSGTRGHGAGPAPPPPPASSDIRSSALRKQYLPSSDEPKAEGDSIVMVKETRLSNLIAKVAVCDECGCPCKLGVEYKQCEVSMTVKCTECDKVIYEDTPETVNVPGSKKVLTDTNIRLVYSSMINDIGNPGLMRQNVILGLPKLGPVVFKRYQDVICDVVKGKYDALSGRCVGAVFRYYETRGVRPDNSGLLNVDVSFDATWMTRGHRSKIGAAFVIEINTGIILDFEVLSTYCHSCTIVAAQLKNKKITQEEFDAKSAQHKGTGKCKINFTGSSGGMEPHAAVVMWQRSAQKNKMQYKHIVSDGDSATYNALCSLIDGNGPYGQECKVIKEECVNHVSKRVGTRLRSLKKSQTEKRETKTGKQGL